MKKLYFDMDGVLVDFESGLAKQSEETRKQYEDDPDDIPGLFAQMDPIPGGLEAARILATKYDCYILSTAPWHNPSAWGDKVDWITKRAEDIFKKKVILTHNKGFLNDGESFLIDDRDKHGADEFRDRHIQLWSDKFPDWDSVVDYLMNR